MTDRAGIVCGKTVAAADEKTHLATYHLGPHYFWFNARRYCTAYPSILVSELKKLVGASPIHPVIQTIDGRPDIWYGDGVAVDLTREPHFFTVPSATMYRGIHD